MGIFQIGPPPFEMKRVLGSFKEGGGVVQFLMREEESLLNRKK
jgi:hypothetical protein